MEFYMWIFVVEKLGDSYIKSKEIFEKLDSKAKQELVEEYERSKYAV